MTDIPTIEPIKPCWHMKSLISGLVDGSVTGMVQKYALWHLAHCPRCQAALDALKQVSERLRRLGAAAPPALAAEGASLSPDRWAAMEAAWEEAESRAP
ncbi:hypothetical protein CCAX7_49860 [Capsulimonas corticalis]|uniref:Uncharacterized protein n=1 Tax=Capsulimonas corticalis TaxID=2219043 RepID=A0A402CPY6_9BACT|nr:hypothetical protein [Capsulimonas corticalis]BDI32935.1 hypothetical protein CCAX7_49860 [Capsulimonas corticalis]